MENMVGNSLDIVIPKSELVDEYNSIDFKGDENLTIFDKMKLIELRYKIGSYPDTIEHPNFLIYQEHPLDITLISSPILKELQD